MKHLLLLLCIGLSACESRVDKQTIVQKDSTNIENDEPIKYFHDSLNKFDRPRQLDTIPKINIPKHLQQFQGSWIRTDFLDTLLKTKSMFQTINKIYNHNHKWDMEYILSFNLSNETHKKDSLNFCMSGYRDQMPSMLFMDYKAKPEINGFPLYEYNPNQKSNKYWLSIVDNQLQVTHLDSTKYRKKRYTKVSNEYLCYNTTRDVVSKVILGKYDLFDKNNKLIKENIYFNANEVTNFPEFQYFSVWHPHENGLDEAMYFEREGAKKSKNTSASDKLEKELIAEGVLVDEEVLLLENKTYESLFALKFERDTFFLYPLKNRAKEWKETLFKKKLYYKLVPKVSK